jgi:short-subunit dehydrogenase
MSLSRPDPKSTVLITGASSGIGTELAHQLGARGHNLVLVARRKERLEQLAKEIGKAAGVDVDVRKADLSVQAQRTRLINALRDGDRHIAGVCNNAGFSTYGKFQDLPLEGELEQVRLNVLALHELTGAFLGDMVKRGRGAILNVASIAGFQPLPNQATYGATKAFAVSLSEAVHTDLHGTGVSCTALCPGPVRTEFTEVAGMTELDDTGPEFVWMQPADVAKAGIEGMVKGKRIVFPSITHQAAGMAGRFAPRSVLLPLMERFGSPSRNR